MTVKKKLRVATTTYPMALFPPSTLQSIVSALQKQVPCTFKFLKDEYFTEDDESSKYFVNVKIIM